MAEYKDLREYDKVYNENLLATVGIGNLRYVDKVDGEMTERKFSVGDFVGINKDYMIVEDINVLRMNWIPYNLSYKVALSKPNHLESKEYVIRNIDAHPFGEGLIALVENCKSGRLFVVRVEGLLKLGELKEEENKVVSLGKDQFLDIVKRLVVNYFNQRKDKTEGTSITKDDVYIVWSVKALQNNKALASTTVADGMYYEITYNGDKQEFYVDAYKKWENVVVPLSDMTSCNPVKVAKVEITNEMEYIRANCGKDCKSTDCPCKVGEDGCLIDYMEG